MKSFRFHFATTLILGAVLLCAPALAQRLPDSVFDQKSQAFGNTLQDVPPDILSVELSPEAPAANEPVWVRAVIKVNPDMSYFRVNRAVLSYSTDGAQYTELPMELVDDAQGLWQAQIPGQPAGTTVQFTLAGWDEIGNAVFQIPVQQSVSRDALFPAINDQRDKDIPDGLDILEMQYGFDGKNFYYCQILAGPFQSFTMLGASANAMAINNNDLRFNTQLSHNENDGPYIAFAPQFEIATIVDIQAVLKGKKIDDAPGVSVSAKGNRVCARAPISSIIKDPKRGVKVFSATVALNPASEELVLVDCSPYAILYTGGASYQVK